jgi:hypothetical protein
MTSRERVLAAIGHTEPDGVPVDLGATPSSGISAIAYDNILPDVPPQNIVAMFEAVDEYR